MLAQSASAQASENTVIQDFNAKLTTRANNLESTHAGVRFLPHMFSTTPLSEMRR